VTIVTIVTLIFASFLGRDGKPQTRLVGASVETRVEHCQTGMPCPIHRFELKTVFLPLDSRTTADAPPAWCDPLMGAGCP
jgi:hypothetical protein